MRLGKNNEGYADPTAGSAVSKVNKEEAFQKVRVDALIYILKYIIYTSGFELIGRITIKDKKTGKIYR